MTWEELKEKAKEMGAFIGSPSSIDVDYFRLDDLIFDKTGKIILNDTSYDEDVCSVNHLIAIDRTPEQMLMIMRGLE